jgi:type II secretory pathway pseudopilin PulG
MMHPATIKAKRRAATTRGGFTLFELLVVAAVIILIGTIIFPALMSTTETQHLVSSGDTCGLSLHAAAIRQCGADKR